MIPQNGQRMIPPTCVTIVRNTVQRSTTILIVPLRCKGPYNIIRSNANIASQSTLTVNIIQQCMGKSRINKEYPHKKQKAIMEYLFPKGPQQTKNKRAHNVP